jgi:hypothetical protein
MFNIAHLTDGGITILEDEPHLTGREFNVGVLTFLGHQLTGRPCAPNNLAALSHFQFDIVNQCACGDVTERESVARFNVCGWTCDHRVSHLEFVRSKDVTSLAVRIVKEGDPTRAVWIILNGGHLGLDLSFVPLEIDDSILPLVTSPSMPSGDSSVSVSSPRLLQREEKTFLGREGSDLLKCGDRLKPSCRGGWSVLFDSHRFTPIKILNSNIEIPAKQFQNPNIKFSKQIIFTFQTLVIQICFEFRASDFEFPLRLIFVQED